MWSLSSRKRGVTSDTAVGATKAARRAAVWNAVEGLEPRRLLSAAFSVTGLNALRADPAYAGIDGSGVTVAVLDSGVFGSHPDLAGNFMGYVDTVRNRADRAPFVSAASGSRDPNGHGTHVAGTIASTNPAIGVANAAKFIGIRSLPDDGERIPGHDSVFEGLRWVQRNHRQYGIRVVNMSIQTGGVNVNTPTAGEYSRIIETLEAEGVTVVAANGNDYAAFRTAGVSSPAVFATIGVVATWEDTGVGDQFPFGAGGPSGLPSYDGPPQADQIAAYSQRGTLTNQLAAPGSTINSTWNGEGGQLYNTIPGTSMASPFVAGVVALMQDAAQTFGGSYLTPGQVLSIVRSTGDTIVDTPNPNNAWADESGNLFDLPETGLSFPRVNVYRAVEAVRSLFVRPSGDADNTLTSAFSVPVMEPGDGWVMSNRSIGSDGTLNVGGDDVDLYKVELSAAAAIKFSLTAPAGAPAGFFAVRLFSASGSPLASFDDPSGYPDSGTGQLPAGVYYLGVSGEGNVAYDPTSGSGAVASFTGSYSLTVSADAPDPDGGIGGTTEVELLAVTDFLESTKTGYLTVSGTIGSDTITSGEKQVGTADVDFYGFFAPDDGFVEIDLVEADSSLDAYLRVFDQSGNEIASDDDSGEGVDAKLILPVTKGQAYFVGASSAEGRAYNPFVPTGGSFSTPASSGAYSLFLEFSNRDTDGTALKPTTAGLGAVPGNVGIDGGTAVGADGSKDVDFHLVTAPSAGLMTFAISAGFESVLGLYRFDDATDELLEIGTSTGTNHELKIVAGANDVFWVAVTGKGNEDFEWYVVGSGAGGQTGAYTLTTTLGAAGSAATGDDSISGARVLGATGRASGTLGRDGSLLKQDSLNDVDLFRYTATSTGLLTVRVDGAGDLSTDVVLRVFDANGTELAFNDDVSENTTNAGATIGVTAGQVYYVGVSAYGTAPRSYNPVTGTGATGGDDAGDYVVRVTEQAFPSVSVADGSAGEGSAVTFTVSLSSALGLPVTVNYATRNGSAVAGSHYQASSGTLTIPAGQTSAVLTVQTVADGAVDGGRSFFLDLSSPGNATLGRSSATGTISNSDVPPDGPDLTAEVYGLPSSFVPGSKKNSLGLLLANDGNLSSRGSVRVDFYASLDGALDQGDYSIGSSNQRVSLRPDQFRQVTVSLPSPTNVPDGNYRIIAVVDGADVVDEADESNNVAVSEGTTVITRPFVDLSAQVVSVPVSIRSKGRTFANIRITNNGNVAATGPVSASLWHSRIAPGNAEGGDLGSLARKLNLRPGQSIVLRVPIRRPVEPGTIFVGTTLSFTGPPGDRDGSNNSAFSSTPVTLV